MPRCLKPIVAVLILAGCQEPSAPAALVASLGIAPVLAPGTLSGVVAIDNARLRLFRAGSERVLDTTVVFPADSGSISVVLRVPLKARSERLLLIVELRVATQAYYSASQLVELFAEAEGPTPTPRPVVTYVGPGSTAKQLRIAPRDTILSFGDSFTFRVSASDSVGGTVDTPLLVWSTLPALPISTAGMLLAPSVRGAVKLRVFTPAGVGDSTSVRFAPAPALLVLAAGAGQTAQAGSVLPTPFVVQVRGPDGLGVPGALVRFRALTAGGSVRDATVVSDDNGLAGTPVTLGPVAGIYGFEASLPGLPVVVLTATATP